VTPRPACPGDAAAIATIWNHYIRETAATFNSVEKTAPDVAATIAANPCLMVAETEGRVAGFASFVQFRGGIGYRHTMEHTVLVAPGLSRRGLGRALMAALEDRARASGVHSLLAGVSGENPAGIAFHRALGYGEVARLPEVGRKFGRWMDLVLMQKRL
jgi:phosphinothricin acetyltransferase